MGEYCITIFLTCQLKESIPEIGFVNLFQGYAPLTKWILLFCRVIKLNALCQTKTVLQK